MNRKPLTLRSRCGSIILTPFLLALCTGPAKAAEPPSVASASPTLSTGSQVQELTLDQCLATAMRENRRRPASKFAVEMAEAQHRQALAGYWPQLGIKGGYQRLDESPDFLFPSSSFSVPAQSISIPMGGTIPVTIPGVGTVPVSSFPVPAQTIKVPAQDVKLMDPDVYTSSLNATWLLYDGGMRRGLSEQTKGLTEMMKQESRRTDLEIIDSVKRLYFGAVLAAQIHQLGKDTLARMEATLNLTETMFKEGSGKVKKTDWLENKVMVESLRSMVALLEKNELMSQAALANTIGLPWNSSVRPADKEVPFVQVAHNLDTLVGEAYQLNPDWNKVEAGLRAAEGAVRTAESGYYPKFAAVGELHKWWNSYDAGVATDRNKEGWSAGVGVEIPIFSGFLTRNKVAETRARVSKIQQEQFLLKEGLAVQIKDTFLGLAAADKSFEATRDAMTAASENRDLNTRAYQNELVETEKVIRAQLMEALMSAQHYKVRYDHQALQSQLNLLVGREFLDRLAHAN